MYSPGSKRRLPTSRMRAGLGVLLLGLVGAGWPGLASADPPKQGDKDDKGDDGRAWVTHRVVQRETLDWIAERYGVSRQEIVRWNKKKLGSKEWIFAGQKLRIHARIVAPPREKVSYQVQRGDTWPEIAEAHDIPVKQLRSWNSKVPKKFKAGTTLVVWTNPKPPPPPEEEVVLGVDGEPLPTFDVKKGAVSIGKPNRGRLENGAALPDSDMYTVRDPEKAFGTTHAVTQMLGAIAKFRQLSGYEDKLVIGAMSLRNGGRFRPHKSHQSGRDVDIRMPRKAGVSKVESSTDIDWRATWELVKAFVATGEVEYIFMSYSRQKLLYRAAKAAGATSAELEIIQYPRAAKTNHGKIRHAKGHDTHIHVRFTCAPDNKRCESY